MNRVAVEKASDFGLEVHLQGRYKHSRVPADAVILAIVGGSLLMMGHQTRSESLFYYFRLEDHVPENHLLRLIDRHVSFEFVREKLKASYSDTGRPSIDPEVLLRILLIGYLYGITSERKLVEELRVHLAWRWFTGLGFDQEIPHHSTFSKNRHGRFQESNLFQEVFSGSSASAAFANEAWNAAAVPVTCATTLLRRS